MFGQEYIRDKISLDYVLLVMLASYFILGYKVHPSITNIVDTVVGKIAIFVVICYLFANNKPILGVLFIFVAYHLLSSNSVKTESIFDLDKYVPTEESKWSPFTAENQFPQTLEEDVVRKMTVSKFNDSYVKAPFKPTLEDNHNAHVI